MERQGGQRVGWRIGRLLPALVLLLVFAAQAPGPARLPSPDLDAASTTDPVPPANVRVGAGDRALTISWDPVTETGLTGYKVYFAGTLKATVTGTTTTATVGGLINGRLYSGITVRTTTAQLIFPYEGADSAAVSGTPHDGLPPTAPSGFTATAGDRQVTLGWAAPADLEVRSYELRRDGTLIASATVPDTSYTDTGRTNGVEHTYTLVAVDVAGMRSAAATTSATPRDAVAPAEPAGLVAMEGDQRIALSWTPNDEDDVAAYLVHRDGTQVATVPGISWVDTGLTNGVEHEYRLVARDTSGNESPLSAAAVRATAHDGLAPAAPDDLAAVPGDREVVLSWTATTDLEARGYELRRDGALVAVLPPAATGWRDGGLVNGTAYDYELVTVDVAAEVSSPPAAVSATPRDDVAPAAPASLVAVPSDGEVALSWIPVADYDVASYGVLRDGVPVAMVGTASWTDTGLVNGVAYTYSVVAVDTSGNDSDPSDPVEATPVAAGPAAPAELLAEAGDGRVALSWAANGEPDLDGYVLLRDGAEIAMPPGTSYVDTDVVNGTTYTYTLVAVDTAGRRSPESDAVEATPVDAPPSAPTAVTASAGDARAVVRWTGSPEDDVVSYRVLAEDGSVAAEVAVPATSATVTGLANGTAHRFTVVAVDASGNVSDPSDEVEVTPVAAPVAVPVDGTGQSGGVAASGDGRHLVIGTRARLEAADTNTAYELYVVDLDGGTRRRVAPLPRTASGMTDPTNTSAPAVSDDGRYVALATTARLLPADTNTLADVYRLDTRTWTWELVSVPPSGAVHRSVAGTLLHSAASVYAKSPPVAMSGDGDVVVFYSGRADLVAGDTNAKVDVFAKRMSTRAVTRISTTATGANLARVPTGPALALTPDGRYALFPAVGGTGPAVLYRKDLRSGELLPVSAVTAAGRVTEFGVFRDAGDVAISDDGRYVAFSTAARLGTSTPAASWTTGLAYRKDLGTGSVVPLGTGQRTVWEHSVELDPSGRYAFYSTAAPALPGDTNGHTDFYRRDLDGDVAGPLVLVTGDAAGRHTAGPTGSVAAAEYGRLLATSADDVLVTTSQALAPVDANRLRDLYRKDLADGYVGTPLA